MDNIENFESTATNNSGNKLLSFGSQKSLIVLILAILILGALTVGENFRGGNKIGLPVVTPNPNNTPQKPIAPFTIVYGNWTDNKSNIKAYDLSARKEYLLAELPINIKKVTVIGKDKLLYISETNEKDHGKNLSIYDLSIRDSNVVYKADSSFGIDDYVLSQNKKYISVWEVSFLPGSNVLTNGKSRVYSLNLDTPASKNLIYDEVINKPAHYPRAITSNGEIFLDTFLPNSGAGWAYGMSVSNFEGTEKKDLENMKNGTYGTQPYISKDEKYLVFSGYDGSDGALLQNGFRKAMLKANTVEILDTQTRQRTKLENLPDNNLYPFSKWDDNLNIILTVIPKIDTNLIGNYSYNLESKTLKKLDTKGATYIESLSDSKIFIGEKNQSNSSLGNLGKDYNSSFIKFSVLNGIENTTTNIKLTDSVMQFIELTPPNYFQNAKEITANLEKSLQLQTFNFKPTLAIKREEQQALPSQPDLPPCHQLFPELCNQSDSTQRNDSCKIYMRDAALEGRCFDSPLYLYGKPGTLVNIKVKTYVYNSSPSYTSKGYDVKLLTDGKMEIDGKIYDRINYDYIGKNISPPTSGTITTKEKLEETLKDYAGNLGLNEKETSDLINYGNTNIKSPFVFVSFYDQETSEKILPLEFNPKPDTYINIVFYFKEYNEIPSFYPIPPIFPNIPNRNGFTAVEISEIVDK